jgi:steroid delta-isomerase-like uncharacterized protein
MSAEGNKAIAHRFAEVFATGDLAAIDELATPGFTAQLPGTPGPLDREGWKQFTQPFFTGFSNRRLAVEDIIAEGDKVVARVTFHGAHTGDFQGLPPTGKQIAFSGVAIFRLAGGKIVEHWGEFDGLGLMQQLGAIPAPEAAGP